MRQTVLLAVLLGALMTAASVAHADLEHDGQIEPAIDYLQIDGAQQNSLTPEAALNLPGWQTLNGESPNFGYTEAPVWLRFSPPISSSEMHQILDIRYPQLDSVKIYLFRDGKLVDELITGDRMPLKPRPLRHPHFLLPYTVDPGSSYQFVVRVQTNGALQVPITLWQRDRFFDHTSAVDQAHAIYYGILITVIFFNLFVFAALREATYLYYALSTLGYLVMLSTLRGMAFVYIWPGSPWLQNQSMMVSVPFALLFSSLFARAFLDLKHSSPALDRWVRVSVYLNLAAIAGTFILDYNTSMRLSVALAIPGCLLLTLLGPIEWLKGNRQAGLYTLAWGALTIGSALTALNKYGIVPTNFVTEFGMEIGSALEAILLSIALAARLYRERSDKMAAQEAQLQALAARRKAELRMMDQALHHPLTGLPNRSSFELHLQDTLTRKPDKRHAVGVIQLTNLQAITKTLGHQNADQVLKLAARRFNVICRDLPGIQIVEHSETRSFFVAALESATFGFVIDAEEVKAMPRRVVQCLEAIRKPIEYLGMQLPLDPLAGISVYPDHATDINTLIRQAYIALESEDSAERGLAYYKPEADSYNTGRLTLVSELREALDTNQLALYFQPKLSLSSRNVVGAEALIRWPGKATPISAEEIISVAEQTGLIKPLTRWVLEQALKARDKLIAAGYNDLSISVNISPNNLREPEFPLFVQRLMTSYHQHAGKIILEVTETSMMQDPVNSLRALRSLDFTGIPLSIDDFGSGYSSLSYIKRLPASEIKIDRSLISDLEFQADDRVIVKTTINMCHDLGYTVVAEGVEDESTLRLLREMNCDMVQGYVMTPPLPFDDFVRWLANQAQQEQRRA